MRLQCLHLIEELTTCSFNLDFCEYRLRIACPVTGIFLDLQALFNDFPHSDALSPNSHKQARSMYLIKEKISQEIRLKVLRYKCSQVAVIHSRKISYD